MHWLHICSSFQPDHLVELLDLLPEVGVAVQKLLGADFRHGRVKVVAHLGRRHDPRENVLRKTGFEE